MYRRFIYRLDGTAVYVDWDVHHVLVYDRAAGKTVAEFDIPATKFDCDLTWDRQRLLSTNWHRNGIDAWDIGTRSHVETIQLPHKIGNFVSDREGHHVAGLLRKGFIMADLRTLAVRKSENCEEGLCFASFSPVHNQLLVPMLRVGKIKEIDFDAFTATDVIVPLDCMVRWIQHSPDGSRFALIDTKKAVSVFDTQSHTQIWSTSLKAIAGKDHVGVGAYSGDGTIVGAVITRMTSKDVVTLDAATGGILNHFQGTPSCCGVPYDRTRVLSMHNLESPDDPAHAFNLLTGTTSKIPF
jgi:hypothetical protein